MIMKFLAILSLILVFWCHQSHHHIFLLINTSPVGLASEEFIPVSSEFVSNSEDVPPVKPKEASGVGSQIDKKSDSVEYDATNVVNSEDTKKENTNVVNKENLIPKAEESDSTRTNFKELPSTVKQTAPVASNDAITNSKVHSSDEKVNFVESVDAKNGASQEKSKENIKEVERDSSRASEPDLNKVISNENNTDNLSPETSTNFSNNKTGERAENLSQSVPTQVEPPLSNTPVASTSTHQKEDEPIPSFMEWTQIQQQKLHESNLANGATGSGHPSGQNGHRSPNSGTSQQNKSSLTGNLATEAKGRKESTAKNFASPDCGAKVIQSNPESQNANGVLSSSHDEYMLNKCGIPIWFIVELCEPLKIEKVSLGNLELFSSSPKAVEIGISDRYPTREWSKLGPFTLPDIRAIHSIDLPATNASTFGKFLKVNVLSHYGDEHFCPLSLVRVNGISEYEVLESENTHPEDIDATDKEEGALYEEPVITDQSPQQKVEGNAADKSVFGTAKDAVINIVRKVAQVVVKSDNAKDASHTANGMSLSNCRSLLQCLPNYEIQFRESVLSLLSCNFSNLLPFLSKHSPWCGWDYCHAFFTKHSIGLPWQPEGFYASIFGGPAVLHALCNYHRPLTKESCPSQFIINASATSPDVNLEEGIINETVRLPPAQIGTADEVPHRGVEQSVQETVKSDNRETVRNVEGGHKGQSDTDQTTQIAGDPTVTTSEQGEAQQTPGTLTSSQNTPTGSNEDGAALPQQSSQSNSNQHQQQHPTGSTQQQQQKESVFVRLSNRIKTLERNQTLTASYLEELSRRFKKQNEENHHVNEGTKTFMNDSRLKFKILEDLYRFELRSLRRNTEQIRERLLNVQLQRSVLILLCLLQFFGIVSVCIWVRKRFRQLESQIKRLTEVNPIPTPALPPANVVSTSASVIPDLRNDTPPHNVIAMRKRLNSELSTGSSLNSIDKSKKIKKKKKKLPDLKPVNVKVSGPASAPIDYPRRSNEDKEFKFDYPPPPSSSSAYDVAVAPSSYNYKENINPRTPVRLKESADENDSALQTTLTTTTTNGSGIPRSTILSTQVDSPFQMITSTSTNFFVDSGVSTSSRFALLASPGPGSSNVTTKFSGMKRSGSLTSLDSSSTSSYSAKTGSHNIVNGHGDSQSQGSNGSGKKRKNKGLKALMPKIFDR